MKFLIADDHAIVRKGLQLLLKEAFPSAQITEASDSHEALEAVSRHVWDVILLDISMPGRNGIDTLKQLRANGVKTPILMLSVHPEDQYALRSIKAGASGFLNKETATEELLNAVHRLLAGKKYISNALAEKLAENLGDPDSKEAGDVLSDREMQVLQQIASGNTVSQIALQMSLSVNTISTYRARLLEKLHLANNAELTRFAFDHKLL